MKRDQPSHGVYPKFRNRLIRLMIDFAFRVRFVREVVYAQPFPRWPYMFSPAQMETLSRLLLSTTVPGSVVEIGCEQGWTSAYLLEVMKRTGINRAYVGIDTFTGFLPKDTEVEYSRRGKAHGTYDFYFLI